MFCGLPRITSAVSLETIELKTAERGYTSFGSAKDVTWNGACYDRKKLFSNLLPLVCFCSNRSFTERRRKNASTVIFVQILLGPTNCSFDAAHMQTERGVARNPAFCQFCLYCCDVCWSFENRMLHHCRFSRTRCAWKSLCQKFLSF
uniref:Uncharacterized protein n=1 Tax=Parascaris univalens TaxID=6257 RepID=A0A915A1T2_PARUN